MGDLVPLYRLEIIVQETFAEARAGLAPILAEHPDLAAFVATLTPLSDGEMVKRLRHEACGGSFRCAGRTPPKVFPHVFRVCARCGESYWSR